MDLVTGSNGSIGNVVVRELLKRGRRVRALIRSSSDIASLKGLDIEKTTGNILDTRSLARALKGIDTVYHLASVISIMPGNKKFIRRANFEGTRNIIEACKRSGVKKLVYTSSIHALAEPPEGTIIDEKMPFDPESDWGEYDRSKALASLAVIQASKDGLPSVVVCPTGVLGPYDFRLSPIAQTFVDFFNSKLKMAVGGAYDFVDVRDVAAGHILAAEKGRDGQAYILSGERVTMDEIFAMLEEITGVKSPKLKVPLWLAKIAGYCTPVYYRLANKTPRFTSYSICTLGSNSFISHQKATRELGYDPRPIRQSIEDTFKWFREAKIL